MGTQEQQRRFAEEVRPSADRRAFYTEHYLDTIRLLTASNLMVLFPGGRLLRECHLGFTRSLIVVKSP